MPTLRDHSLYMVLELKKVTSIFVLLVTLNMNNAGTFLNQTISYKSKSYFRHTLPLHNLVIFCCLKSIILPIKCYDWMLSELTIVSALIKHILKPDKDLVQIDLLKWSIFFAIGPNQTQQETKVCKSNRLLDIYNPAFYKG